MFEIGVAEAETVVTASRPPLFSFVPIARFGLECLSLAHYLGEPGIGIKERVRRSINERIVSAFEQSRLSEGNSVPSRQERLLRAEDLGFARTYWKGGSPPFLVPCGSQ